MQPGLQDREEVPSSLVGAKSGDRAPSAYDGFISYSHAADGQLAPALQDALQRFAKPWYKRRALRLFRDKTTLTATPALWPTIETALNQSRFFLLLASPDAARSHWVQQELEWWLTHRSRGTLLIAITGGALVWDDKGGDFDWNQTDALAIGLKGVFSTEPLWVDLRFAKQATQLSPKDPAFQNAVADLAAPLRGQPKDDLIGEDVRQHRRTLRLARGAVATLIGLVVALTVAAVVAVKQRDTAISQQRLATSRQLSAQALNRLPDRLDLALLLANQAYTIQGTIEARGSLLSAQEFSPFLTAFLHGHTGIVDSVAFNPDGSLLAGGSSDGSVWIWSVATRQPVGPPLIGGHSAPDNRVSNTDVLNSVAFSPDGQLLASGGADQKVRLWNVASRSLVMPPLEGHDDIVDTVAFSHDGKRLASAGWDRTIRLWDPTSGQPAGPPLEAHEMPITSIAFSPDDRLLASACMDGSLLLWDLSSGQPLIPPLAYPKAATGGTTNGVAFSPDGTILASTSNDGTIRLWDVAKRAPRGTLSGYGGAVTTVVFSPDGAKLVFGGEEGTLRQWDVAAGRVIGVPFEGHAGAIISVGFSPNGTTLASASEDGTVRLWDAAQRPPLSTTLSGHRSIVGSAVFSPDGKLVASASNDQTVQLWDAGTGKPVGTLIGHTDIVNSVAFSADGTLLASGSQDGTVRFWDVDKRQAVGSIVTGHTSGVKSVALSRDGRILATGGRDEFTENPSRPRNFAVAGSVRLWDASRREPLGPPLALTSPVNSVALNPDATVLVSGSSDSTVRLWDVSTRKAIGPPLIGHRGEVNSVAFSPDGTLVASGSADHSVRLWDVARREGVGTELTGHTRGVEGVAFSPDGALLASVSNDRTLRLWDVANREPLASPIEGGSATVAFAPDGKRLVSAADNGNSIRLWDIAVASWLERTCRLANRNFTEAEWIQFLGPQTPYRRTCPDLNERRP